MKLLIDVGNSRVKWGEMRDGKLEAFGSCVSRDPCDVANSLKGMERPEAIYIASVANEDDTTDLSEQLKAYWEVSPHQITSRQFCCGVENGYREPAQMGVDRWAAMIAAFHLFGGPLCVIDCGSAMTVDALNRNGQHLGGLIVPGWRMQLRQLKQDTARVNDINGKIEHETWGRDTATCAHEGAIESMACLIDRSTTKLARQLGTKVTTVLTGGDAGKVMRALDAKVRYEEHLVLQGIALIVGAMEG